MIDDLKNENNQTNQLSGNTDGQVNSGFNNDTYGQKVTLLNYKSHLLTMNGW